MILINFFASFSIFGMEFCVELCLEKINIAISISGRKFFVVEKAYHDLELAP